MKLLIAHVGQSDYFWRLLMKSQPIFNTGSVPRDPQINLQLCAYKDRNKMISVSNLKT